MADPQTQMQDSAIPERAVTKVEAGKEPPRPARVLSIHAHPDDQEFTVGGTLAKWARAGTEIITVCITSGDAGSNEKTERSMTKEALIAIREEEQRNACRVLGVKDVVFLRYPDGALQHTIALRRDVTRLIRRYKPDAVICGDPTVRFYGNSYMNHPDHRVAADVALDAVFPSAGTRLIFTELLSEGLEPHEVSRIFIHGSEKPDTFVDISETVETKVAGLKEHRSQIHDWDPGEMMREWAKEEGAQVSLPAAEAFRLMILKEERKNYQDEKQAEAAA